MHMNPEVPCDQVAHLLVALHDIFAYYCRNAWSLTHYRTHMTAVVPD